MLYILKNNNSPVMCRHVLNVVQLFQGFQSQLRIVHCNHSCDYSTGMVESHVCIGMVGSHVCVTCETLLL